MPAGKLSTPSAFPSPSCDYRSASDGTAEAAAEWRRRHWAPPGSLGGGAFSSHVNPSERSGAGGGESGGSAFLKARSGVSDVCLWISQLDRLSVSVGVLLRLHREDFASLFSPLGLSDPLQSYLGCRRQAPATAGWVQRLRALCIRWCARPNEDSNQCGAAAFLFFPLPLCLSLSVICFLQMPAHWKTSRCVTDAALYPPPLFIWILLSLWLKNSLFNEAERDYCWDVLIFDMNSATSFRQNVSDINLYDDCDMFCSK